MLQDPFGDPFRLGSGPSQSEIFKRRGGGVRAPRKSEAAPESEPGQELQPDTAPETAVEGSEEHASEKVVLKNPKWEVEKVGFNEETDISVEAELPESQAHKTKVEFELFAKTPKGPESISKGQGTYRGRDGPRRASRSISPNTRTRTAISSPRWSTTSPPSTANPISCKDETVVKEVDDMADRLIESHILQDVTFATGKSFISPGRRRP